MRQAAAPMKNILLPEDGLYLVVAESAGTRKAISGRDVLWLELGVDDFRGRWYCQMSGYRSDGKPWAEILATRLDRLGAPPGELIDRARMLVGTTVAAFASALEYNDRWHSEILAIYPRHEYEATPAYSRQYRWPPQARDALGAAIAVGEALRAVSTWCAAQLALGRGHDEDEGEEE